MKHLLYTLILLSTLTQYTLAEYPDDAIYARCEYGQVNGKYIEYAWDEKVCAKAIKHLFREKGYPRFQIYLYASEISDNVCRSRWRTKLGQKACQSAKVYLKKYYKLKKKYYHNPLL